MRRLTLGTGRVHTVALLLLAVTVGCDVTGGGGDIVPGATNPGPTTDVSGRDFCSEAGFVDGEQRDDQGRLVAECRPGPTPEGGAYSIARYSDDGEPADKDAATAAEITEYDEQGNRINTTYGTLGGG